MRFTQIIILLLIVCLCSKAEQESSDSFESIKANSTSFSTDKFKTPTVIQINGYSDKLRLSQALEIEKIIPLETSQESLIGEITKIKVFKDLMYILDAGNTKKLAVFDMEGNHIRNIGTNGGGPGEYNGLTDFTINTDAQNIIILDRRLNLLIYSSDGEFIRRESPRTPVASIAYLGEGLIALYSEKGSQSLSDGKHKLRIYDLKHNKIISKHFKIDFSLENKVMSHQSYFSEFEGGLSIHSSSHDTIMQIQNGTIEAKYVVRFDKKPRPTNYFRNAPDIPFGYQKLLQSGYPSPPNNWIENRNSIHFTYSRDMKIFSNFYSKSSSELIVSTKMLTDDSSMGISSIPIGNTEDKFIFKIEPEFTVLIRDYHEKQKNKPIEYPEKFKKILNNVEADHNPLIVFTSLKDNN